MSSEHTGGVIGVDGGRQRVTARWVRLLAGVLLTGILLGVTLLSGVAPAQAVEGLQVESTSRYTLDLDSQSVSATITMTLRNTTPDEPLGDGGFRYYFYDAYAVPLPAQAEQVRATSDGRALTTNRREIPDDPGYRLVEVGFPDLLYGQTRRIELSFTLTGQPPRTPDPTRIGSTYATFPVFGPGDEDRNTVEIVAPQDTRLDSTAGGFRRSDFTEPGTDVWTSTEDNLDPGLSAMVSITRSGARDGRPITAGGVELTLIPFPNDEEWADFIEEWTDIGLSALVDLVGAPWPGEIDTIREDSGSQIRGFDGWYSTSDREIVLSEALDPGLLFHELSHAWFNGSTIADRWLYEGLAEFVAEHTAAATGGTFTAPATVGLEDEHALPLATWTESPDFRGNETDAWAYPASHRVVSSLLSGLSDEQLRAVLADTVSASSPWDLEGERHLSGGALRTTAFLDILAAHEAPAAVDGSDAELSRRWVLDEDGIAALDQRPAVRSEFDEFAAAGPWAAPLGLRRAMAQWDFVVAQEIIAERADLPAAAARAVELTERTGTPEPVELRELYENADTTRDYTALQANLDAAIDALERYARAQERAAEVDGPFAQLGATVLRLDETLAAAHTDIALGEYAHSATTSDLALERADRAGTVGAAIVTAAVILLILLATVVILVRRSVRRRRVRLPA